MTSQIPVHGVYTQSGEFIELSEEQIRTIQDRLAARRREREKRSE